MTVRHPGRKAVSERLLAFIAAMMKQFRTGADELWARAERKRDATEEKPREPTDRQK